MANIQSLGVGSGLDVNAIVTQLLAIEKQPLDRLKKVEAGVQAKISTYGNVRSKLDSLETAAGNLVSTGTWSQTTVDLGGAQEISVTASGTGWLASRPPHFVTTAAPLPVLPPVPSP
jgi:flagellar hook-associated protein 2